MRKAFWAFAAAVLVITGCNEEATPTKQESAKPAPQAVETKKVEVGKNVYLEVNGDKRRVLVNAAVCLRQGQLEQFLTRKRTKEHEAVLAADVDARDIHTALVLARAEPGKPVTFRPKYTPASGPVIKVSVEYTDKGKKVNRLAQEWIRNIKTKKDMEQDWVFAGSLLIPDPLDQTRKPFYAANDGDVICLSNFDTAMLDLPVASSTNNDDLFFEAHTERIPPLETPVLVILEPALGKK
ncbi:MAG: YdjY domain-containing protein [Gemmataceae bacterium]|nr:YdjY domain-containing protein [Gemmataceae bacterium]MCI0741335.1 YdjY domain-containing protein [Gemmataceae bacterium]